MTADEFTAIQQQAKASDHHDTAAWHYRRGRWEAAIDRQRSAAWWYRLSRESYDRCK